MFNDQLALALCKQMAAENDVEKLRALNAMLISVLKEDMDEARLRAAFLKSHYNLALDDAST